MQENQFNVNELMNCGNIRIMYTSRYYDAQKIRRYQKFVLQYDYTNSILLNTKPTIPYCLELVAIELWLGG